MAEEIVKKERQKITTVNVDDSEFSSYLDTTAFNQLFRVANMFAGSSLVPEQYRGKPNDCFIVCQMAFRLKVDPLMLMQKTYVVHGKPGMESQLLIALANTRGPFTGPIQWKFDGTGNKRQCTAYATHKISKAVCEATVTWDMAEKEGWIKKAGSKWQTIPDLMFQYRSATFLVRLYCPEVAMGFPTVDELDDIDEHDTEPAREVSGLEERLSKKVEATVSEPEEQDAEDTENS